MGADTERLPPKKEVMIALLEESDVFIHLDPRPEEVRVPQWFKKQPQLVLQVGLNMPVAIRDLEVSDDSVSCTLSFNRSPFFCFLPWKAIYALVGSDGRAMVWPEDIPPEVAAQAAKAAATAEEKAAKRAHLRAVPSGGEPEADAPTSSEAQPPVAAESVSEAIAETAEPVPTEPASVQAEPPAVAAGEGISEDAPRPSTTPDMSSPRAATPSEPPAKGKRPLPPWLRVVK
ncbi:MAG: hypothetical protein IPI67_06165 [Myxococcales bacterium]|nr:hypothetical protein [Myxococcales bacterium]